MGRRPSLRARIEERAGDRCEYCQAPQSVCGYHFHLEHVVPLARGGSHAESNRALACASCNLAKADRVSGVDPRTGSEAPLFHPRLDDWHRAFLLGRGPAHADGADGHGPRYHRRAGPEQRTSPERPTVVVRRGVAATDRKGVNGMTMREAAEKETATPKILVVDDEPGITAAVSYNLRQIGCAPVIAGDAEAALRLFEEERPDLVILDIMLPSGSGFDVCRLLRQSDRRVPILMLTARVAEEDRVRGLEGGADDYLVKPFGMRELLARVKALLRRAALPPEAPAASPVDLQVNLERREVRRGGEIVSLSRKEFDLLVLLWSHPGRVWDRQTLLDRVWGADAYVDDRTVDVHIRWLREKIEPVPGQPQYLLTVRGVGYKFRA